MAYDNLSFLEARRLWEKNDRDNEGNLAKSLKNFPSLPSKNGVAMVNFSVDALRQGADSGAWLSSRNSKAYTVAGTAKEQMQSLLEAALNVANVDTLISRLKKTIELHIATTPKNAQGT